MRAHRFGQSQRGASTVEFALVAAVGGLLIILIGIFELGRILYIFNSASEATRLGARTAIVCDAGDDRIQSEMVALLPWLSKDQIVIHYEPAHCASSAASARSSCTTVTVSISPGTEVQTIIPLVPIAVSLPPFSTTLTREAMNSRDCR